MVSKFFTLLKKSAALVLRGGAAYYVWIVFLLGLIAWGVVGYLRQIDEGLLATSMRDPVSWGFYIGNFTFLVGVAAAAVLLVIPAYVYNWKPIKEVAIFGELLAISALVMCMLFVTVDIGRADRVWHMIPFLGSLNVPSSLLAWDVLVLNAYLTVNVLLVSYLLYSSFRKRPYNKAVFGVLVLISIPIAIGIHTVTAFVYNGLAARPYWNASILAPKFLASAFCSGPAVMLILFEFLRRRTPFRIKEEAIWKLAELMAYAMVVNLLLLGAEVFKEYYSHTHHLLHMQYLFTGIGEHKALVPYAWTSLGFSVAAMVLFLIPATRRNFATRCIGCLLIYAGVYIEKGMGLVIPGYTPSTLGEIYEYVPTMTEVQVGAGIFAVGFLVFTLMCKIAVPITLGQFTIDDLSPRQEGAPAAPSPETARAGEGLAR